MMQLSKNESELPGLTLGDVVADSPVNAPEQQLLSAENRRGLLSFLQRELTPTEYAVLMLRMDGYAYDEISAKLGKSRKSVDGALQRAKKKVAGYLAENSDNA